MKDAREEHLLEFKLAQIALDRFQGDQYRTQAKRLFFAPERNYDRMREFIREHYALHHPQYRRRR